ncbi:MAG: hypothetical protein AAF497_24975, partial [Planctomycetota bacterium]
DSGMSGLEEWTDGFRRGAQVAIQGGYRDRVISPFASRLQFPDKLDEYRNQVRTRRTSGATFQSPAMSDEYHGGEWVDDGSGTRLEVQPIEVDGLDDSLILVDPESDAVEAPAGDESTGEMDAGESGTEDNSPNHLRVPTGRDEDVDPFQDMERELVDPPEAPLNLPSAPELQLLDDDLSSMPRRRSFGDYRNIIEASQGNVPSAAYASAVAAAQAARNGKKLEWQAPMAGPSEATGTGFSEAARGSGLPIPIHGSHNSARVRARLRTTEEVSRSLQLRFRDLDEVQAKGPDEGEIWGSRFQRTD